VAADLAATNSGNSLSVMFQLYYFVATSGGHTAKSGGVRFESQEKENERFCKMPMTDYLVVWPISSICRQPLFNTVPNSYISGT
jgi:hypothetical protein